MQDLAELFRRDFEIRRELIFDPKLALAFFQDNVVQTLVIIAPLLLVLAVVSVAASVAISGWNYSIDALAPKFEKLDPIKGTKRLFNVRSLVELVKALIKFMLLTAVAAGLLWWKGDALVRLGFQPLEPALADFASYTAWFFLILSVALVIVAGADVPFQLWDHKRQLKMTHQEVREERKQMDGSPEVKGRIRQMQYEMARRRMMAEVPKADVIVTNPTHYAVALRYDQRKMRAPKVVAKGKDLVAAQIRSIASAHNIPVLSSPALARALFHSAELDQEIPAGLYRAVAQVLAYVFQLRGRPGARNYDNVTMHDVPIPDDLRRDA